MTAQASLFDPPARAAPTSREAARSMRIPARAQRLRVLAYVERQGTLGATQEEASIALGIARASMCGRFYELERAGLITKTNEGPGGSPRLRYTRSGRRAVVYIHARFVA